VPNHHHQFAGTVSVKRGTDGSQPGTGEAIKLKASKKIAFRASKDLKEAVM
jgi:nucleoid DNA-binding protein